MGKKKTGKFRPAVDFCKEKGYEKGTVLVSSAWNKPRIIVEIDYAGVWLQHLIGGQRRSSQTYIKKFPLDVTTVNGD